IHRVGPGTELGEVPAGVTRRSFPGHIVMPGLVNCHTHLGNGFLRGVYDEMPLEVWFAKGMWPVVGAMNESAGYAGACLSGLELLTTGVTTTASGEVCTPRRDVMDGVMRALEELGMRARVSRMVMDSADETSAAQYIPPEFRETPEEAADEVARLQARYNSDRIAIGPEALGVLRCTPDMIRAMHECAVATG